MISIFVNSWKVKEIRSKMLYTLLILAIVRLGAHVALPGIDMISIKAMQSYYSTGTLYNIIAGGANSSYSIFALGIGPYITSSIIMQLLTVAIPRLDQLSKEGEEGRKKIQSISRYLTIVLAALQSVGITMNYRAYFSIQENYVYAISVISMVCGTALVMWLAEQITEKGVGNGSSMIIFVNIVSSLPRAITTLYSLATGESAAGWVKVVAIIVILIIVMTFVVFVNDGERRLPVQYSSKTVGRRQIGGKSTFMPIKVNTAGVISIIFAISLLQFPQTLSQFIGGSAGLHKVASALDMTKPLGAVLYILLIFFFTYFYTSIVMNPNEIADNMRKNGGFIPGIRPGAPTSNYITKVLGRITFVGAVCYACVAIIPLILQWVFKMDVGFGGTTLIIVAGVALDINKALESQLLQRHYKGFLSE